MDAVLLDIHCSPQISYIDDYSMGNVDEHPLDPNLITHQILHTLKTRDSNDSLHLTVHSLNISCDMTSGSTARRRKKMSQHRLLIFLRFLDTFVGDFVSHANKIADYHNNLIFRRIRKELFTSLREHFNYRMAPNPYSSDIVFTAFFLFNVLAQSAQKQSWNPVTLPDHLTEIYSQRDAMKRLVMMCVRQYQEVSRAPKDKQSGVPPNRYYRCLQPFFKDDAFIVLIVHTIQDHISFAIQTVTRYIEQRKEQINEQKRTSCRRTVDKVLKESDKVVASNASSCVCVSGTERTGGADVSPIIFKGMNGPNTSSTSIDEFTPSGTQEFSETPAKADSCQFMFSASQDQADQWLTDYLQYTNSGFYVGEDFDLNDSYFLSIN